MHWLHFPGDNGGKDEWGKCRVRAYFFQQLNTEVTYDPAIPQLGWKAETQTDICTQIFRANYVQESKGGDDSSVH